MEPIWWFISGVTAGGLVMLPVARLLLRRAEKRARKAERRARDAERLAELGSMTGGLAHEIKNPLSTIGLNAQLLAESINESSLPDDQKERLTRRLQTLSREVERLRGILADFLQFAGRMKLDPQPRDLVRLVDEICDFFLPQVQKAGIVLRTQLPKADDRGLIASVDEGLIKQALLNLMLNAAQAMAGKTASTNGSGAGEMIVRVEADDEEARIHVIDTGPGVPPDKLDEIFRPYVTTKAGGTGLGLPTAKRIAQEHGGELTVFSEPGRGSDFVLHLPLN